MKRICILVIALLLSSLLLIIGIGTPAIDSDLTLDLDALKDRNETSLSVSDAYGIKLFTPESELQIERNRAFQESRQKQEISMLFDQKNGVTLTPEEQELNAIKDLNLFSETGQPGYRGEDGEKIDGPPAWIFVAGMVILFSVSFALAKVFYRSKRGKKNASHSNSVS